MSKYIDASVYAKKPDDDDDWETDGDYVNDVSEKQQRKGGTADRFEVCMWFLMLLLLFGTFSGTGRMFIFSSPFPVLLLPSPSLN